MILSTNSLFFEIGIVTQGEQKSLSAFWRGGYFIIRVNKESLPVGAYYRALACGKPIGWSFCVWRDTD